MQTNKTYKLRGERAAKQHRKIQTKIARADSRAGKSKEPPAMQAGARKYPEPPLPGKKLKKPGRESDLSLEPMYDAPYYQGSGKLQNMVALITGGDSGIGRSVAILFAREGADVAIIYLNEHKDAKTTKTLVEHEGRKSIIIPGDVTDKDFCTYAVKATINELGRLDILVNNSAFQMHVPDMAHLSEEHFDLTLKTNLYGYFHMTQAALPHLKKGSSIINTGSVAGIRGSKAIPDYSLTKGGIHAWTRALSGQLISQGIRVNAVAPGPVWTPLNPSDRKRKQVQDFGADTSMKRVAQPEEIAPAYVFLASPQCSSYITGEIIPIIGGY
ncbi:MAG TPA: SDR family oxidoreductase [Chryseolinea sp.]|nr:SDR family oxidoreductase [Chryseolinea sp.]